jgi:hypothetical protein
MSLLKQDCKFPTERALKRKLIRHQQSNVAVTVSYIRRCWLNISSRATLTGSPSFSQPLRNTANALILCPLSDIGLFSTFVMIICQSFYDGHSSFAMYHIYVYKREQMIF